jgi:RNA polymerase sigma-70 factor (ECF subfamily)
MTDPNWLADRFEQHRTHLQGVAYRMLGSLTEADDAVQQAWLKLSRADTSDVENLGGWLTTVVARVCLDMLRSRESRREEPIDDHQFVAKADPEQETILANSVGLALLVILETLPPPERLAFVLHDLFGMSFEEIAPIVDRTPAAARQLASRARRRVQGSRAPDADIARQREVVDAFLAATRRGDFEALLTMLDPEVTMRGAGFDLRGASAVAQRAMQGGARAAQAALINGEVGVIVAPRGRLKLVLRLTIADRKIVAVEAVTKDFQELELHVL